jgi:hypothetical protein
VDSDFLDQSRSHLLFRSASLTDLPTWSREKEISPKRNKAELVGNARLAHLANSLTAWDKYAFTSFVENSRRAKNYLWRTKPIGIWPDWHEILQFPGAKNQLPEHKEYKYETQIPLSTNRSPSSPPKPSPITVYQDIQFDIPSELSFDEDSDESKSSRYSHHSKLTKKLLKKQLSISTKTSGILKSNSSAINSADVGEKQGYRSYSDGDLTDYLKGFSELKASLQLAQLTCNMEIRKILDELELKMRDYTEADTSVPHLNHNSALSVETNSKCIFIDSHVEFMDALLSVISVAQNILDLSLTAIMAPGIVPNYTFQLQQLQSLWQKKPQWDSHDLVLKLLVVFSSVARIMEYFEEDLKSWVQISGDAQRGRTVSRPRIRQQSSRTSFRSNLDYSMDSEDNDSDYSIASSPRRHSMKKSNLNWRLNTFGRRNADPVFSYDSKALQDAVNEDQSVNVLMELNELGVATYVSPTCLKVFQYPPQNVVGKTYLPFLIDSTKNVFQEAAINSNEGPIQLIFTAKRLDERQLKMEGKGIVKRGAKGEIVSSVWIIRPFKVSRGVDSPNMVPAFLGIPKVESDIIPNVDLALCNICERSVPAIAFKSHSDICLKIHKTEMDLVLLNDQIKDEIQKCSNLESIITDEIEVLEKESSKNNLNCAKHLNKLKIYCAEILQVLNGLKNINIPESNQSKNYAEVLLSWECPSQIEFIIEGGPIVAYEDDGLKELGMDLYSTAKVCQELVWRKKILIDRIRIESTEFQDTLDAERDLIAEIQLQTVGNFVEDNNLKYQTEEIGGVMVKVPSIMNINDDKLMGASESIFFTNSTQPLLDDSFGPPDVAALQQKKGARRATKKPSRVNAFGEETERELKRLSIRNPKMVVGEKSLDIDISSPILNSKGFSFTSLINSSSSSNFPSPQPPASQVPSIKDYNILKAISRGAFGSVYLARKKITDDYFAIKVLKKSDMVAKNQAINIKSERAILAQIDSPYIVKLYCTFQSRNRIFLVMEYLNGGDCASLLKSFGQLEESWSRQYISEMIEGLEFLHQKDIVHRYLNINTVI